MTLTIHTLGDSHAYTGWSTLDIPSVTIITHWLGPKLMHSFNRDGFDLRTLSLRQDDFVIFCFGEIDVRCHIHNWVRDDFHSTIDTLISDYFSRISKCVSELTGIFVKVGVYFIPPAAKKETSNENKEYPFSGTDDERKMYVTYMNQQMRDKCNQYGFIFFDLFDAYCDDGFLKREMSDGHVHIKNTQPLIDFIRSLQ